MGWMSADPEFWRNVYKADKENIKRYGFSCFGPYDGTDDDDDEDYSDEEWED